MATILRDWSYRYQWLYDAIARIASIAVGGESRFRQLPLQGLSVNPDSKVLDLCCGSGQSTRYLTNISQNAIGLDAGPRAIQRARENVPEGWYIQAFAEDMPFPANQFDLVHTCAALHEMQPEQLRQILREVFRVLKPGGIFTLVDFHAPTNPLFWPGLALFLWLFETETAWQLIESDLGALLGQAGFEVGQPTLYAGGTLQVIQARKSLSR